MRIMLMMTLLGMAQPSGQVAKFDEREPVAEYISASKIEDIERCFIRAAAPPYVYRQPDRPDEVMIVWSAVGVSSGNAAGRVDLKKAGAKTSVKSWFSAKITDQCAPH